MSVRTKKLAKMSHVIGHRQLLLSGLFIGLVLLTACTLWSITLGAAEIDTRVVYEALSQYDATNFNHLIIQTVRLPRVLSGLTVGAALAVAGALMQGLTHNPLADGGLLGINSGAAFAIVIAIFLFGSANLSTYALCAFAGAALTAILVYGLGSLGRGGTTPLKLTLAGVVVSAFLSAFTTAILIRNQTALEMIRFWTAGSLSGRDMLLLLQTVPYIVIGLVGALVMSKQITTISLGDDIAKGLGQNTIRVKAVTAIMIVMLSGGAVALAGPIGFVGLLVPHIVRFFVGMDYRWILPYSAIAGALLVTIADVAARVIIRPQELPVGIMMAIIGAPFFIWLARWRVKR